MSEVDVGVNSAVMEIRRWTNAARLRLGLPFKSYAGVPTVHTCPRNKPGSIRCNACMARETSV